MKTKSNFLIPPPKVSNSLCDEGVRGSAGSALPAAEVEAILSRPGGVHDLGARGCHGEWLSCSDVPLVLSLLKYFPSGYGDTGLLS